MYFVICSVNLKDKYLPLLLFFKIFQIFLAILSYIVFQLHLRVMLLGFHNSLMEIMLTLQVDLEVDHLGYFVGFLQFFDGDCISLYTDLEENLLAIQDRIVSPSIEVFLCTFGESWTMSCYSLWSLYIHSFSSFLDISWGLLLQWISPFPHSVSQLERKVLGLRMPIVHQMGSVSSLQSW